MKRLEIEQMERVNGGGGGGCEMLVGVLLASGGGILSPWGPVCIVTFGIGVATKYFHGCGY